SATGGATGTSSVTAVAPRLGSISLSPRARAGVTGSGGGLTALATGFATGGATGSGGFATGGATGSGGGTTFGGAGGLGLAASGWRNLWTVPQRGQVSTPLLFLTASGGKV